jgi:AraC-like DNA-binding protein
MSRSTERTERDTFDDLSDSCLPLSAVEHNLAFEGDVPQPPGPQSSPGAGRLIAPLPKWRYRRIERYIDDHLEDRIMLADMARTVGLTRMHFAAQFRVATGVKPHEFLLQRRIARACGFLRDESLSLVEIALKVGFQSQAHFTTVFKRIVGETPNRWRRLARLGADRIDPLRAGAQLRC